MSQNKQQSNRNEQQSKRPGPVIGYVLSHEQFPVPELIELGVQAEQAGFDAVWASDHFQPWQDNQGHAGFAWATLAALGQRTSRLIMGTGVTCPTFRYHPAIVAQAFATLGQLYPGRVFLGLGTGEALNEKAVAGWGDFSERQERLEEAIEVIRRLWEGEVVNHHGRYYTLEEAKLYDLPQQPVPIYIAAGGKKSMRSAGELGDGLVTSGARALEEEAREAFAAGARSAGKDPADLAIVAEHMVIVGDEEEARRWTPYWRFIPNAWGAYVNISSPREIQRRAEQEVRLEDVYTPWPVSADPEVHAAEIHTLLDDGVTHVFVHSPQGNQRAVIDYFGSQVLPRLGRDRVDDVYMPPALPHLENPLPEATAR